MRSSEALALQGKGEGGGKGGQNLRISGIFYFAAVGIGAGCSAGMSEGPRQRLPAEVFIALFPKSWRRGDGVTRLGAGAGESSAFPAAPAGMPAGRGLRR